MKKRAKFGEGMSSYVFISFASNDLCYKKISNATWHMWCQSKEAGSDLYHVNAIYPK